MGLFRSCQVSVSESGGNLEGIEIAGRNLLPVHFIIEHDEVGCHCSRQLVSAVIAPFDPNPDGEEPSGLRFLFATLRGGSQVL